MSDSDAAERNHRDDLRATAIVAFLSAGVVPAPSKALMVTTLAEARRSVASFAVRSAGFEAWLAEEIARPGIPENAAVLVIAERLPSAEADGLLFAYANRHPEHAATVEKLRTCVLRHP